MPRWWKLLRGASLLALVGLGRGSWLDGPLLAQVTTCFTPAATSPVAAGTQPRSVAVGNFNGDSFADLAVANETSANVTILLGDGSGAFTPAATSPVAAGTQPRSVAVGNFNGDSFADLAVANLGSANVTILLGDGSGAFTRPPAPPWRWVLNLAPWRWGISTATASPTSPLPTLAPTP